jgi:NTE family protein
VVDAELMHVQVFQDLEPELQDEIVRSMRLRQYAAEEVICRAGEPGNSLFVIQSGLANVLVPGPQGNRIIRRLRRGDTFGEDSLITGESRSATVAAVFPTDVLELTSDALAQVLATHPELLTNITRIAVDSALAHRLASTRTRDVGRRRGEAIAVVFHRRHSRLANAIVRATIDSSPRKVALIDLTASLTDRAVNAALRTSAEALTVMDDLLASSTAVISAVTTDCPDMTVLFENMDRILFVGELEEVESLALEWNWGGEAALVGSAALPRAPEGLRVVRTIKAETQSQDIAWLGRHLARTKLGLALGAGGAKGFAHVGALKVIEEAGYVIDYVAGSSMGAVIGAWVALGMSADRIESLMRAVFTRETVQALFKLSLSGISNGAHELTRLVRETTEDRTFSQLAIPLVVMTVDLNARRPAAIMDGPVWEALVAASALPGLFPPHQRGNQRLVDGLALVPVPTQAARDAGADIVIASNILSWNTATHWPGQPVPPPPRASSGSRLLDTLLEVMDLGQYDSSVRHAAQADVVMTPCFGPGSWRDFHLADFFMASGRAAAEAELPCLRSLTNPNTLCLFMEESMTGKQFTFEDLKDILVQRVGLRADSITNDPDTRLSDLGLDSLSLIEIQLEVQQRYGLTLPEDAAQIETIGQAIKYANDLLQGKQATDAANG